MTNSNRPQISTITFIASAFLAIAACCSTAVAGLPRRAQQEPDVEAFPGEIDAVSVSKPTLEDVFIQRTGHRFWSEVAAGESALANPKVKKKGGH